MDNALVERVARAIHNGRFGDREPEPFEDEDSRGREYCFRLATAALNASGIDGLVEALEPLAREYDAYCEPDEWADDDELADIPTEIKFGDLRRAHKVLSTHRGTAG